MTDSDIAAIKADIAKYPATRPPHDPVTYCRQLLGALRAAEAENARLRGALTLLHNRAMAWGRGFPDHGPDCDAEHCYVCAALAPIEPEAER